MAQSFGGQPFLGDPLELEQEHVPRLLSLLQARCTKGERVADRERDEPVDPVRRMSRGPGHRRAPVVSDDRGLLHADLVQNRRHVRRQPDDVVGVDLCRLVGLSVPALIGTMTR